MMLWAVMWLGCSESDEAAAPARKAGGKRHVAVQDAAPPVEVEAEVAPASGRNRPPVIERFTVSPGNPTVLDTVKVTAEASDPDGTELDLEYRWEVDGATVAVRGAELPLGDYKRGQQIAVTLTVSDGDIERSKTSEAFEILDAPPQFITLPEQIKRLDGFRLQAEDPDGDSITWSLEGAPPMLTVDARGVLHWKGSEDDPAGSFVVKIKATDPSGEAGTIELPVDVSAGSKSAKAVDKPG